MNQIKTHCSQNLKHTQKLLFSAFTIYLTTSKIQINDVKKIEGNTIPLCVSNFVKWVYLN